MLVIILVHIAITLVELVVTSRKEYESLIRRLEGSTELASYCDPDYYVLNITSTNADFDCKMRCRSLHGYVTSRNELVCFVRKSQAKRISSSHDEKCVCGHKAITHDNRQPCFPRLNLQPQNFKECDRECLNHTLLQSKKLNEKSFFKVMWCGKEWFENNVIERLDSSVKVVGEVETQLKIIPTASCYCGSKTRKAKTFLSQETVLENEKRVILQTTEGPISNELAIACSFGKFRVKKINKCNSICTTTKGFILPGDGKLICYDTTKALRRSNVLQKDGEKIIENKNICECRARFGRDFRKNQPCIPEIKEEDKMNIGAKKFKQYCERKCSEYDAYIVSNTEMYEVVFCEIRNTQSKKKIVDLDFKFGKEIISENDEPLIECECGLTALSLIKYGRENIEVNSTSQIASSSNPIREKDHDIFENRMQNHSTMNPLLSSEFNRPLSTGEQGLPFQEFFADICNVVRTSPGVPTLNRGSRLNNHSLDDVFNELSPLISSPQIFPPSNQKKRGFQEIMPKDHYVPSPTCHHGPEFDEFSRGELLPDFDDCY